MRSFFLTRTAKGNFSELKYSSHSSPTNSRSARIISIRSFGSIFKIFLISSFHSVVAELPFLFSKIQTIGIEILPYTIAATKKFRFFSPNCQLVRSIASLSRDSVWNNLRIIFPKQIKSMT